MAEKNTKGAISIRNVTKIYDPEGVNVMAVDDCSLEIKSGEVCMIVGPSGCGKTTLLNAIAGFHSVTQGEIYLDNEILCGPNKPLADQGSDRIVVFQHGALFPWKTLQENVAYGPIVQKVFETVGFAKVATSAKEAKKFSYLRKDDKFILNRSILLHEAKNEVLTMSNDYKNRSSLCT